MTTTVETDRAYSVEMTNAEYHAQPEWSNSQLKLLPGEPELFHDRHVLKLPDFQQKTTPAMQLGIDVHRMVLDGDEPIEIPRDCLSASGAKAGKEWQAFLDCHYDKVLCKEGDPRLYMARSILAEPVARKWLDALCCKEKSLFFIDPVTGLKLRSRLDVLATATEAAIMLFDVKTTSKDPYSEREIKEEIVKRGYHRQGAFQWEAVTQWAAVATPGRRVEAFTLVFVRSSPPHDCHCHELPGRAIVQGRAENRAALDDLDRRLQSGNWKPKTYGRVTMTDLPEWYYKRTGGDYE